MRISDFVKDLGPFVSRNGWKGGLLEYEKARMSNLLGNSYNVDGLMFSPLQGVWKLLLPEKCQNDVLVADGSLGAIPLELCKSFSRVLAYSFYEGGSSIISAASRRSPV